MKRRAFTIATAAGATAALLGAPTWLSRALAQAATPSELNELRAARERARVANAPLLILVVPADAARASARGDVFGDWLNWASDEGMADLGQAELACATIASVRAVFPNAGSAEPWLIVATPNGMLRSGPADATELEGAPSGGSLDFSEVQDRRHVDALERAARGLLGQAPADRRAAFARAAIRRWRESNVPGSRWGQRNVALGCGPCGMGSVGDVERRFLDFYADDAARNDRE